MALINCPQCGKQVSDKAAKCPHCGWDFTAQSSQSETRVSESDAIAATKVKHRRKWPILVIISLCLIASGFALWFFVLNNNTKENKKKEDATETQKTPDSSALDERYLTQDLRMWDLFGPVKGFQTTITRIGGSSRWSEETLHYYSEEELYDNLSVNIQFDEQGHFVNTLDGRWTIQDIDKKDGDRIIVAKIYDGDFDFYITKQWSYYPNGLLKQSEYKGLESYEKCQYFYSEKGELTREETKSSCEGYHEKNVITYSITNRDEHGNWTQRIAEVTTSECEYYADYDNDKQDYVQKEVVTQKSVTQERHKRTILYYGQGLSSQYVVINGTDLRLRLGPSTTAKTYKHKGGGNIHPYIGEKYIYLGESGDFYKIDYKGHELWVSKKYTYLE